MYMGSAIVYGYIALSLVLCGTSLWSIVLLTPVYILAFLYISSEDSPVILVYGLDLSASQVDVIADHIGEETGREVIIYEVHE